MRRNAAGETNLKARAIIRPMTEYVQELLCEAASKWPRHPAVIDECGTTDFQTLLSQVEATRRDLESAGLRQEHCLGLMARDGRGFIVGALAAVGCGAVVMPIAPRLTKRELSGMLSTASVHVLLDDGSGPAAPTGRSVAVSVGTDLEMRMTFRDPQPSKSVRDLVPDAAFIRFTSGTTGASKGVVLSHRAILERTAAANRGLQLGCEDRVLWVLPMAYHFFVSIVLYLRYGAAVVVCRDHLAQGLIRTANRRRATFLYASPLHYRWLAADQTDTRLSSLRAAVSTSTRLDPRTAALFTRRYGLPVAQAYGIIEVGLPAVNLEHAEEKPESIGRPLPDYQIEILDDDRRPVPEGHVGQLAVRGPGMFSAYLNPPLMSECVLVDGWFPTADLARKDSEGFITVVGRCKSVITVGGEKVFPEEVQDILNLHPMVSRSRVRGRAHPYMGEVVHAEIVPADANNPVPSDELIAFCRLHLSSFKAPQSVEVVERIEETASEKIRC
ncbi:MAG: class I adenylate-forming enzyme family protein [Phycisphaerae bacterium]